MRPYFIVVVLSVAAFGASITHGFHFDDAGLFADPTITQPDGWQQAFALLQTRPLTWFTFWLNDQLNGSNPLAWHGLNICLHAANAALLYAVLQHLVRARVALVAAALFAIHPIQSETVAYVFSRGTELCTLFCLLAFLAYLRSKPVLSVFLFAIALLAKEECVTFPLFLALLDGSRTGRIRHWRSLTGMLLLSAAAGVRAVYASAKIPHSNAGFHTGVSVAVYLAHQGFAIVRYLWLLVIPVRFTIDPELPDAWPMLTAAWVALILLTVWAVYRIRTSAVALFFVGGLLLLLPSSSIFPAADLAADHRMYLPLVALTVCPAILLQSCKPCQFAAIALVVLTITWTRMPVWASDHALWSDAVRLAPHKVRPLLQLSRTVEPAEALALLDRAEHLSPDNIDIISERGKVYLGSGKPVEGLREFGRALALSPNDAHALNNRGVALEQLGQHTAARADFRRALRVDPCLLESRRNLGMPPCPATAR